MGSLADLLAKLETASVELDQAMMASTEAQSRETAALNDYNAVTAEIDKEIKRLKGLSPICSDWATAFKTEA